MVTSDDQERKALGSILYITGHCSYEGRERAAEVWIRHDSIKKALAEIRAEYAPLERAAREARDILEKFTREGRLLKNRGQSCGYYRSANWPEKFQPVIDRINAALTERGE